MRPITLYINDCRGKARNNRYPDKRTVTVPDELREVTRYDHVCAEYRDFHRGIANFISADCVILDCDNTHSDDPAEWIAPSDVRSAFPGVELHIVYSRNNMKEKDGRSPRPRYHVVFPIERITDAAEYAAFSKRIVTSYPQLHFDPNACDAGRFFFGVEEPQTEYYDGFMAITEFMAGESNEPIVCSSVIPVGRRNATLSRFAGRVLKKYGDEDGRAYRAFLEEAAKCEQPLDDAELQTIWNSALKFYHKTVSVGPGYKTPPEYAAVEFEERLEPLDYSDVGQATVFTERYGDRVLYSEATSWMVYDSGVWTESENKARGLVQEMTGLQLKEARIMVSSAQTAENAAAENDNDADRQCAKSDLDHAKNYRAFVLKYRNTSRISNTLTEAAPGLEVGVDLLDADAFMLNTPAGTVDLRTGELLPHDPKNYCTKMTAVSPSTEGAELWAAFLERITCGDKALAEYHQLTSGMEAVGKVFCENLVIAHGIGGNGKSTYYNAKALTLGDYAGSLSAETLTVNCRKNKSPEYAELRGKRLVIAAELEEGMRLDTAVVKKLCSTDPIYAEKKYKDPFSFIPSHTTVLYTNHLPKVGTTDKGTWDRLVVVPFKASIRGGEDDVKNYAEYLLERAGGAILSWIIEGARKFIAANYRIEPPECVKNAVAEYRADNDWLKNFIEDRCEVGRAYREKSGELYAEYRSYCLSTGDYTRSAADLKAALTGAGYESKRAKEGVLIYGLRIVPTFKALCA